MTEFSYLIREVPYGGDPDLDFYEVDLFTPDGTKYGTWIKFDLETAQALADDWVVGVTPFGEKYVNL